MTASTVFGIPMCIVKKWWFRVLCVLVIVGVAFARMELGVHTLTDCIAGISLGFGVILILNTLYDRINGDLKKIGLSHIHSSSHRGAILTLYDEAFDSMP